MNIMMKKLLLLTAVFLAALSVSAQRTISGQVIDSEEKEAVIQATVALLKTDSSMVSNAVTNVSGQFKMTAPSDGNFLVRVTYVGYKPLFRRVAVSDGKPVALGSLTISPDSRMLKNVDVVKNIAKVVSKGDTVVYNAGAYRTPEGSVVEELVKKLPGAEIDDDGTIKINGKTVKKVLIDGKEFMTGDTKTAIKNLPTSIVDRIKSYDEKSDLSRITGIDDGEEQTVLDFGLKPGMNRGVFANLDAGVGTHDRYSARGMGAMMQDDLRLMGMANANNVNDVGFGGGGFGGRFGGGGRNGLQTSKMVATNINYEKKDVVKADGSVRWNHNNGDVWSRRSSENFVATTGSFSNSINQNYTRSNSWDVQGRVEWTPDTLWNISFRPTWSYGTNDGTTQSGSASFSDDPYDYELTSAASIEEMVARLLNVDPELVVNQRTNNSLSYSDSKRLGGSLQINRRLGSGGRNVTLRFSANYSDGASKSLSSNQVELFLIDNPDSTRYQTNRYNLTPQKSYDYSARFTYSEPIFTATFLQFSYNFQYRYTKSDRATYDFSWDRGSYLDYLDFKNMPLTYRHFDDILENPLSHASLQEYYSPKLSKFSQYKNFIHTAEVMLRVVRKDYNFNVGVQIMPQSSQFTYRYNGYDDVTRRTVVNWSPTANFRWRLSQRGQMRLEYRGSTSQPSMSDLLPIEDNSDPLNITKGNPGLKPSFTQRFMWRYNNYFERHQRFINANASFSTTSNSVSNMVTYNPVTGGRTSQPQNISGNWNIGGNFMMNTALDTLGRFNINTSTDLNYANYVSYLNLDRSETASKNSTRQTTIGERLGFSYRNDWLEVELNGRVNYNYVTNKLQPQSNLSTWGFSYGFNTTLQAPWGMQFTTSMNMSSRRGYSDDAANTDELIWNAQISQSFLTGKPLSLRLEFYDILKQQSNFSRIINAMSRTDEEYNSINSYVMLRATYRLNLFGTKEARQMMRRGPGGEGPGFGGPGGNNRGNNRGGGRGGRGGFGGGFGGFGGPGMF